MVQSQSFHFVELMRGELPRLCREKRTGMLFVAGSDNRLAQFGLDQGEIVFLVFQNKRGLEALSSLKGQDFKISVCRFFDGQASPARLALPPTDEILKQLVSEVPRSVGVADPVSGRARPTVADPVSGRMLSDQTKAVLKQELAEFIGPMAGIVCEETWASVGNLAQALDVLSRELLDPKQATRFQQNVLKRLAP